MERNKEEHFNPLDRIGQLTMRNLDIAQSREKLHDYSNAGVLNLEGAKKLGLP